MNTLLLGNCLELMDDIPNNSIDLVLCDLPYGITQNKWDCEIDLKKLWKQYRRIGKPACVFALNCSQPFTSTLILSALNIFKYEFVWNKINRPTGFLNAKKQPLRITESLAIFYAKQPVYNPQMIKGTPYSATSSGSKSNNYGSQKDKITTKSDGSRYPTNLLNIKADCRGSEGRLHPTQKPIELSEYIIKTYTNPNQIVLDNCCGSGTTLLAAKKLNRNYIGIEQEKKYYLIAKKRLKGGTST